jgi:hypothetical protein
MDVILFTYRGSFLQFLSKNTLPRNSPHLLIFSRQSMNGRPRLVSLTLLYYKMIYVSLFNPLNHVRLPSRHVSQVVRNKGTCHSFPVSCCRVELWLAALQGAQCSSNICRLLMDVIICSFSYLKFLAWPTAFVGAAENTKSDKSICHAGSGLEHGGLL